MFGRRLNTVQSQRSRSRAATALLARNAGPQQFGHHIPDGDARPRGKTEEQLIERVDGTGIRFVVPEIPRN
jgi:hypothetical protein